MEETCSNTREGLMCPLLLLHKAEAPHQENKAAVGIMQGGLGVFSGCRSSRCSSRSTGSCWRLSWGWRIPSSHRSCLKGKGWPKPSSIAPTGIQVSPGWDPAHSRAAGHEPCPRCPSCTSQLCQARIQQGQCPTGSQRSREAALCLPCPACVPREMGIRGWRAAGCPAKL